MGRLKAYRPVVHAPRARHQGEIMSPIRLSILLLSLSLLGSVRVARAQDVTTPPSGDNQKCSVIQGIGLATVRIDYSSPDVHSPTGEDRAGKIWGDLVPYGMTDLGFNNCTECPWRAGANENTVFTVSHDVLVEGQRLAAGSYGLHMMADPNEWTLIFSRNYRSWGSYSYRPEEDALRVKVKPSPCEYHEWLTYEFTDRQPDQCTVALKWEKLQVPWTIKVDNLDDLYIENLEQELRGPKGFTWINIKAAADYALRSKTHLDQALIWAREAADKPGLGQVNLETLGTLAQAQLALGQNGEARKTLARLEALDGPGALELHQLGRQMQGGGYKEEAMMIFRTNARRHPNAWPVNLGLARGYQALGDTKQALNFARKAIGQVPDDANRKNVERFIQQLEGSAKK